MKIYIVIEQYYDYCNQWETEESYWMSEGDAIFRQLVIEEDYKSKGKNPDQYYVCIKQVEVQ